MVKTYSLKKDGNERIQPNFKVKEFACKDGSDTILIDSIMVEHLQKIRDCTGATSVHVSSGYRTVTYNAKIGGSVSSKHTRGLASDFCVKKGILICDSKKIACIAEILGAKGIEQISDTYLHIDTREGDKWFSIQYNVNGKRYYRKLTDLGYRSWFSYTGYTIYDLKIVNPFTVPAMTVKKGDKGESVRWVQYQLVVSGFLPLLLEGVCSIDGVFGNRTEQAVLSFQKSNHLQEDGKVGGETRRALEKY